MLVMGLDPSSVLNNHPFTRLLQSTEFNNHWVKIVDFLKKHMYYESLD